MSTRQTVCSPLIPPLIPPSPRYPDMLQVGCKHGPGGNHDPGLSLEETRSHFGSWAIVSSPLTLSHDVNDANVTELVWPIISNKRVLAINQAYVGDSGGVYDQVGHECAHGLPAGWDGGSGRRFGISGRVSRWCGCAPPAA